MSQNVQNKQQFRKVSKHCKSQTHTVRNFWNDDLNNVHHSKHGENQRSSNFEEAKMCKTNRSFEQFEDNVNLVYTVCAMLEMMI